MFICQHCQKSSNLHENPTRVVTKTRVKEYPERLLPNDRIDKGGVGEEIVEEILVHAACAAELEERRN